MKALHLSLWLMTLSAAASHAQGQREVGSVLGGGTLVATGQTVNPAGQVMSFPGRPLDQALSADGGTLLVKTDEGILGRYWEIGPQTPP